MRKRVIRPTSIILSALTVMLSACASSPDSVGARYVSPVAYQGYACDQLGDERHRLGDEVNRIAGLQRENANGDAVLLTVGLVIFWPALIGMAATKDRSGELGKLKGEYEAVESQMRMKQCTMPIPGIVPPQPAIPPVLVADRPTAAPAARDLVVMAAPAPAQRRSLGLEVLPVDEPLASATSLADQKGVYVLRIMAGGAADSAGLRKEDVILSFGPSQVATVGDMQQALAAVSAGSTVPVTVWRDQQRMQAQLRF